MSYGINSIDDIPERWREIFNVINSMIPGSLMAGGCLRDRDLGFKVKDIDIFVPQDTGRAVDLDRIVEMLATQGLRGVISTDKMYPISDNKIVGVIDIEMRGCPDVQLIVGDWGWSNDINALFERFDFGICQIAFNGMEVLRSAAYRQDYNLRRFSMVTPRSRQAFELSIQRYARLTADKFKGWTFHLGLNEVTFRGYHQGGFVSGTAGWREGLYGYGVSLKTKLSDIFDD